MLTISSGAMTHVGLVRQSNEDSMLVTDRLVAVADGLGGHAAGEVASRIAVERMRELADSPAVAQRGMRPDDVVAAIVDANQQIVAEMERSPSYDGMGTTLTGVGLVEVDGATQCVVFNVGDSRVYRHHDGVLTQVSVDHSEVEEMRAAGFLTAEAAAVHPRRNVVTRCLGSVPSPTPDLWVFPPTAGERFLVCSDGLTGEVDDAEIAGVLAANPDPDAAAGVLVEHALAAGGRDNIAVIVVDLADVDPRPVEAAPQSRASNRL